MAATNSCWTDPKRQDAPSATVAPTTSSVGAVSRSRNGLRPTDPYRPESAAITGIRLARRAGAIADSVAAIRPKIATASRSSGRITVPA
jgi:hypothetical protein